MLHGHLHHGLTGVVHDIFFLSVWGMFSGNRHSLSHQCAEATLAFVLIVAKELLDSIHGRRLTGLLRRRSLTALHLLKGTQQLVVVRVIADLALLVPAVHGVGYLREDAHIRAAVAGLLVVVQGMVGNLFGVKTKVLLVVAGTCSRAALVLQKLLAHVDKVLHDGESCTSGLTSFRGSQTLVQLTRSNTCQGQS